MRNQTITAVYDSVAEAESASRELAMKVGGVRAAIFTSRSDTAELQSLGIVGPDRSVLEEAIHRGGAVLSATVPDDQVEAAADVIEATGAVDLDAREAEWRKTGWTDAGTASTGMASTGMANTGTTGMGTTTAATSGGVTANGQEEVIPIVEERLQVGKRETLHGRVRVRSYVVETPVQEQVTLHQEHVHVERRPVDRAVGAGDAVFQDRTIEATETAEEAVVAKEARVREEVVVRKTVEDESRTVRDTVRRTEVEVDDDRKTAYTGTTPAPGTTRGPNR